MNLTEKKVYSCVTKIKKYQLIVLYCVRKLNIIIALALALLKLILRPKDCPRTPTENKMLSDFGSNGLHVTPLQYSVTFWVLLKVFNYIYESVFTPVFTYILAVILVIVTDYILK